MQVRVDPHEEGTVAFDPRIMFALALGVTTTAYAAEPAPLPGPPPEDELPIPTLEIDRLPPSTSYEFAVQFSYGTVTWHRASVPPWIGFGFRGGWGKNIGNHRIGPDLTASAEGPIGVNTTLAFEPHVNWDYVANNGLLLGAGFGPATMFHFTQETIEGGRGFNVAPSAVVRIGWSQTWSRVGRRLFVFLEPKVRYFVGMDEFNPRIALAVGSGRGK